MSKRVITKKAKTPSVALPAGLANTAWHMLIMREFTSAQARSKCYKHGKEKAFSNWYFEKKRADADLVTPEVQLSYSFIFTHYVKILVLIIFVLIKTRLHYYPHQLPAKYNKTHLDIF